MKIKKKNIILQMLDVVPVDIGGGLNFEKIKKIGAIAHAGKKHENQEMPTSERQQKQFSDILRPDAVTDEIKRFRRLVEEEAQRQAEAERQRRKKMIEQVSIRYDFEPVMKITPRNLEPPKKELTIPAKNLADEIVIVEKNEGMSKADFFVERNEKKEYFDEIEPLRETAKRPLWLAGLKEKISDLKDDFAGKNSFSHEFKKQLLFSFSGIACVIFLLIAGIGFAKKGLLIKDLTMKSGKSAYGDLAQAKVEILNKNFKGSGIEFNEAYERFSEISADLNGLGGIMISVTRYVPYFSKLSSGAALAEAGKDISKTGVLLGEILETLNNFKNPLAKNDQEGDEPISLLKIFRDTEKNISEMQILLADAQIELERVNVDDLPVEQRNQFVELKHKLPEINRFLKEFVDNSQIFTDVLGGNGPRKYLFLFQNNQEMRATGGFIGTYGVLDIFNGRIRSFFIDGIFNPDGQLRAKVVPPAPIQKISAAWSLHDSNWFPDFPVSAEKATWFYEKTGGPTVDGVITMTPVVMQKLLEVTGPIEMTEYEVTIDKDNFLEKVQQEVEVDYDKELNQPKKILADLAPKILDKIFNAKNISDIARTLNILTESLNEKQILIYSKNYEIEKRLSELGWSGEILDTQKDYLSVVNTNINGYKTDGVIEEKIEHLAEIQEDGSIVDSVTITRHHNGGNEKYEWWNKVNADYMRVYVPRGSQLLEVSGQTREFNAPPLDYVALNFKRDAQVQTEEDSMSVDEASGTRVYEDAGKTVFANWVYVSPQETVQLKYKYVLPFKLSLNEKDKLVDTYSLLAQKQSGSVGSELISQISLPDDFKIKWKYPDEIQTEKNNLKFETNLKSDKFIGVALVK